MDTRRMLDTKTIDFLKKTLRLYISDGRYKTFIFGSRATQTNRKYSDIDLGISGPVPLSSKQYIQIKDALEESDLPYKVDVVDFSEVSEEFKKVALRSTIRL